MLQIRPTGLEPVTFGLGNRCTGDLNYLSNQELIDSQKPHLDICLDKILQECPDLKALIEAWQTLPKYIKLSIMSLVETAKKDPQFRGSIEGKDREKSKRN